MSVSLWIQYEKFEKLELNVENQQTREYCVEKPFIIFACFFRLFFFFGFRFGICLARNFWDGSNFRCQEFDSKNVMGAYSINLDS